MRLYLLSCEIIKLSINYMNKKSTFFYSKYSLLKKVSSALSPSKCAYLYSERGRKGNNCSPIFPQTQKQGIVYTLPFYFNCSTMHFLRTAYLGRFPQSETLSMLAHSIPNFLVQVTPYAALLIQHSKPLVNPSIMYPLNHHC